MTYKEHLALLDKQVAAHDRQITAIRDLVREGLRLVVTTRKEIREVIALQKHNDEQLMLINTTRRGTNGHTKKKIDLQ